MQRTKRSLFLLTTVSIVISLGMVEGAVRILDVPPHPLDPLPWKRFKLSSNEILRWEHEPNASDLKSHINADGFPDTMMYEIEKQHDHFRIVVIGDSVTSFEGGTGDNWTELLEVFLNQDLPQKIEIINMAVGGYDTYQQVEYLKVYGMKYRPDLVLVGFCLNDHYFMKTGGQLEKLVSRNPDYDPGLAADGIKAVNKYSRFAFLLYYHTRNLIGSFKTDDSPSSNNPYDGELPSKLGLKKLLELKKEVDFDLRVVVFPYFHKSFGDTPQDETLIRQIALDLDIADRLVILRDDFAKLPHERGNYAYDRVHLTKKGHWIVAKILRSKIGALLR